MSSLTDAQKELKTIKELDKYFIIQVNVDPVTKYEIGSSENLDYNEIMTAFALCALKITNGFSESEKKEWVGNFLGLFPENDADQEKQVAFLNDPRLILKNDDDFILFVIDLNEGSCLTRGSSDDITIPVATKILYWAIQVFYALNKETFNTRKEGNILMDVVKAFELAGIITRVKK